MAYKYKLKEDKFLDAVIRCKGKKFIGSECSQEDLEFLYDAGIDFVEREEVKEKKESKKVSKKEESLEDEQGQ